MDEAPIGPKFREEVEAFLSRTDMKPYKLGEKALGDPSYVPEAQERGIAPAPHRRPGAELDARHPSALRARERVDEGRPRGSRPSPQSDEPMFLSTRKAAALLSLSPRTLDRYRENDTGPPYFRLGQRIVYAREDLLEWAWSKRVSPGS